MAGRAGAATCGRLALRVQAGRVDVRPLILALFVYAALERVELAVQPEYAVRNECRQPKIPQCEPIRNTHTLTIPYW